MLFTTAKTCNKQETDISVLVIDRHISKWDVISKFTVPIIYRSETCLIIFRDVCRLSMIENRVLRMISGAEREIWQTGEKYILSSFLTQYYWVMNDHIKRHLWHVISDVGEFTVLSQSQCSGCFTIFVLVFVMFLYSILYCHVFGKVTSFVYPLTLCSRILK